LPVDRDGPHPRRGAVPAVHQVPARHPRARRHRLGHAAYDDRRRARAVGDGRFAPPAARRAGRDERQEHRRESDDPHDLPVVPHVPPRQHAAGGAVGEDGDVDSGGDVRRRGAGGTVLRYRGYFVEAIVRIGYSVYQVGAVLACIVFVTLIDVLMARGAESLGAIQWGRMPPRSQYALFILAVTFTWLMGLMGFARSGIRQHW